MTSYIKHKYIIGMKISKRFFFFTAVALFTIFQLSTHGQKNFVLSSEKYSLKQDSLEKIKPLIIGDKCPDIVFNNMINWPSKSAKLSDFKGKWVILDFWFIACAPCIAMLPKTAALEKKFNGKVQFMPITFDEEWDVKSFFSKLNNGKGVKYPSVTKEKGKTLIRQLFYHIYAPHYVWIDPQGYVRAITDHTDITEQNISAFLAGYNPILPVKRDQPQTTEYVKYEPAKPLLISGNGGGVSDLKYHSIITGYINMNPVFGGNNMANPAHIKLHNQSIVKLFRQAYSDGLPNYDFPFSRTLLKLEGKEYLLKDILTPNKYTFPIQGDSSSPFIFSEWARSNTYCYNLELPAIYEYVRKPGEDFIKSLNSKEYQNKKTAALAFMKESLKIFPIEASFEIRKVMCRVLVLNDSSKLKTDGGGLITKYDKVWFMEMKNVSIKDFLKPFEDFYFYLYPVIDETAFSGRFDIDIKTKMSNMSKVNEELEKYGLKFIEAERFVKMLVLREHTDLL